MNVPYPLTAVLGDTGDGKTVTLTALAYVYDRLGYKVYANFELKGIPYTPITFQDLIKFDGSIKDGVVLIDEGHVGLDALSFWSQLAKDINVFTTQRRKLKISMYISTQNFMSLTRRMRTLVNYVMECNFFEEENEAGDIIPVVRFITRDRNNFRKINTFYYNAKPFFDMYDTDEIITLNK